MLLDLTFEMAAWSRNARRRQRWREAGNSGNRVPAAAERWEEIRTFVVALSTAHLPSQQERGRKKISMRRG